MLSMRAALLVLAVYAAGIQLTVAAEARKQWRPATAKDIARQQALTGAEASAAARTADIGAAQPLGQQAYIDPLTNELISNPSATSPALPAAATTSEPDFALQRTPEGFLYIDTSDYRHIETVIIDAPGALSTECSVQSPWSEPPHPGSPTLEPDGNIPHQAEPQP